MSAFDFYTFTRPFGKTVYSENRATGLVYVHHLPFNLEGSRGPRTVRGTKLVLTSAGAFGSPGILERSVVGTKDVLERHGVGVMHRVDLPRVDENCFSMQRLSPTSFPTFAYADHNILCTVYYAADEAQTLGPILRDKEGAVFSLSIGVHVCLMIDID